VRACVERVRWVAWDGSGAGLDRCVQGFEHGIRTGSDQCIGHLLLLFFFYQNNVAKVCKIGQK
jgi:hypothetical protein